MKSLSEIETVSKRSTRAAGYSWGIAEEVGKNIRMLEMFGLPGIKNLNHYFKVKREKNFENLSLICNENKNDILEFCPIIAGLSFLDQSRSLENLNLIKFEKIAYPLLFLPFISRASEVIGKKIQLKIDNKILTDENKIIQLNDFENNKTLKISFGKKKHYLLKII